MNDSRKNPDHLVRQEAQTPQYSIRIIGLKSILLYWLNCFLSSEYEEKKKRFTDFSQNTDAFAYSRTRSDAYAETSTDVDWLKIPLQKSPLDNLVLYTSALPQILSTENAPIPAMPQPIKTQQIVTQLHQFQMQSSKQYLNSEDAVLRFLSTLWHEFEISSDRAGWIAFRLSESGITKWLQHIIKNDIVLETHHTLVIHKLSVSYSISPPASSFQNKPPTSRNTHSTSIEEGLLNRRLWQAQHTYARCCSFLHQGIHSGVYQGASTYRHATEPIHVSEPSLCLGKQQRSPASQRLAQQLIDMGDAMFWIPYRYPSKQYLLLLKATSHLCQSFEQFQREDLPGFSRCGDPDHLQPYHPQWATRFDLIIATRNMLKTLLQSVFQVIAPSAL